MFAHGVRSRYADSHLGHVFNDGRTYRHALLYKLRCIKIYQKEDLHAPGYGELAALFEDRTEK